VAITPDGSTAYVASSLLNMVTPIQIATNTAGTLLAKILARAAEVAAGPPEPLTGQRLRPARLG